MKITKSQLKELIKEEIGSLFEKEQDPDERVPQIVNQFMSRLVKLLDSQIGQIDDIKEVLPVLQGVYELILNHPRNQTDFMDSEKRTVTRDMITYWRSKLQAKPDDDKEPELDLE